jgi:hypothetical protein
LFTLGCSLERVIVLSGQWALQDETYHLGKALYFCYDYYLFLKAFPSRERVIASFIYLLQRSLYDDPSQSARPYQRENRQKPEREESRYRSIAHRRDQKTERK